MDGGRLGNRNWQQGQEDNDEGKNSLGKKQKQRKKSFHPKHHPNITPKPCLATPLPEKRKKKKRLKGRWGETQTTRPYRLRAFLVARPSTPSGPFPSLPDYGTRTLIVVVCEVGMEGDIDR